MRTILFFALLALASCNNIRPQEVVSTTTVEQATAQGLDAETVLTASVVNFEGIADPILEKKASSTAKKQRKKKPTRSLDQLANLISALDSTTTNYQVYEEYGDALLAESAYDKAYEAYKKSKELGHKNLKTLYFKMARAKGLNGKSPQDMLHMACVKGYNNYRSILYDPAFNKYRERKGEIAYLFSMYFSENSKALFKLLKVLAPKNNLSRSYTIDAKKLLGTAETEGYAMEKVHKKNEKKWRLMGDYGFLVKALEEAKFTRSILGHKHCEMYVNRFKEYDLLICSSDDWADYIQPRSYYLITCDKQGKKIDALKIAQKGSMKTCQTAVLNPDGSLVLRTNAIQFKKRAIKAKADGDGDDLLNYDDLASIKSIHEEMYQIQANGKIVNTNGLLLGMK